MARKFAAVVFSLGCLQASSVMALGLGELTLDSFLNEPLNARVDLLNTGGLHQDEIRIRLATKEDFDKLGLHRAYFLTNIKFEVVTGDSGNAQLVISSDDPVLEPYLDFIVEARWPSGRLLREYTVLVDPPVFDQSSPVISASARVAEVDGQPDPLKKTQDPAAVKTSGTHVSVKKSELAPGAMPQRDYNAEASPTPMPGSRYMVHRDDTLWEIALQARPEGASVHQTMLDIQRINPDAFIDGNINRVKSGYIIYLPDSGDISSADLSEAMAEVRQQNEDWREGRASQPRSSGGPSLRISAEPEATDSAGDPAAAQAGGGVSAAAMEELEKPALDRSDSEQRLVAMEQQVETLQRIVSLKDDQIAALQSALAEADGSTDVDIEALPAVETDDELSVAPDTLEAVTEDENLDEAGVPVTVEVIEEEVEPAVEPEPVVAVPAPAARQPQAPESGGFMSNILYIVGAAVLALLGFFFMRRRGGDNEEAPAPAPAPREDVFADVQLKGQELEVEAPAPAPAEPEITEAADEEPLLAEEEQPLPSRDSRGYGERKHDEYASDVDSGDALAEADIYIAYGRYPQAIDLLNNAIGNEPNNPAYRLKLLEMHAEMGDRDAAMAQFAELQSIDDPGSLSRAQEVLDGLAAAALVQSTSSADAQEEVPADLTADSDAPLEADFSGLEIEDSVEPQAVADDLDLSADFADSGLTLGGDDEDLVIAAESNGMSTKLDLARAYLDMGDDEGARQILEEVAADATDAVKAEAEELLGRIG